MFDAHLRVLAAVVIATASRKVNSGTRLSPETSTRRSEGSAQTQATTYRAREWQHKNLTRSA